MCDALRLPIFHNCKLLFTVYPAHQMAEAFISEDAAEKTALSEEQKALADGFRKLLDEENSVFDVKEKSGVLSFSSLST